MKAFYKRSPVWIQKAGQPRRSLLTVIFIQFRQAGRILIFCRRFGRRSWKGLLSYLVIFMYRRLFRDIKNFSFTVTRTLAMCS